VIGDRDGGDPYVFDGGTGKGGKGKRGRNFSLQVRQIKKKDKGRRSPQVQKKGGIRRPGGTLPNSFVPGRKERKEKKGKISRNSRPEGGKKKGTAASSGATPRLVMF